MRASSANGRNGNVRDNLLRIERWAGTVARISEINAYHLLRYNDSLVAYDLENTPVSSKSSSNLTLDSQTFHSRRSPSTYKVFELSRFGHFLAKNANFRCNSDPIPSPTTSLSF